DQGLRPEDGPGYDEYRHRNGISAGGQQGLEAVHAVDVFNAHHRQQSQHYNAHSGAKVSNINRRAGLNHADTDESRYRRTGFAMAAVDPAGYLATDTEKQSSPQEQPGNHFVKS